jgi:hypothetical protein
MIRCLADRNRAAWPKPEAHRTGDGSPLVQKREPDHQRLPLELNNKARARAGPLADGEADERERQDEKAHGSFARGAWNHGRGLSSGAAVFVYARVAFRCQRSGRTFHSPAAFCLLSLDFCFVAIWIALIEEWFGG